MSNKFSLVKVKERKNEKLKKTKLVSAQKVLECLFAMHCEHRKSGDLLKDQKIDCKLFLVFKD
jgi:hypothetical protein